MTDYLHRPTGLQAGTTYRVDTGATNGTAATITRVDPKTAIDGSKVRAGDDGTVTSFVGTAATLYLRPLDYLGQPGTAVTSTGYTFPTPAPDTGAQTTGALPATGYTGVADLTTASDVRFSRLTTPPITLTAAAGAITPDATLGTIFRHTATADVRVNEPIHSTDGQMPIWLSVLASGANRTLSFAGGLIDPVIIPSGTRWVGILVFDGSGSYTLIDNNSASGSSVPSSGGSSDSSRQTVMAANPAAETGLSAITADGSTNDAAALQAALDYVENTWGSGFVLLPKGTIKLSSGITIPEGVQIRGISDKETVLNFTTAGTSAVAVTAGGDKTYPLRDLALQGPNTSDKVAYPTNTCVGLRLHGIHTRIQNLSITGFYTGIDLTEDNTFFFLGDNISIRNAGVGIDMNQRASHNGGVVPSENGERMVLLNSAISNSQVGIDMRGSGVSLFMANTSIDYCGIHAIVDDSFLFATNCHFETGYAPTGNVNWGSVNRWMFQLMNTARVNYSNCRFEVRDVGVFQVATTAAGPVTYNSGYIRFATCTWYGQMPGAIPGTAPHGESRQYQTKDMFKWKSDDGDTKYIYSPFATKWNTVNAYPVSTDGAGIPTGHAIRVTSTECSSVAGSVPSQRVNLARDLAADAVATDVWVCIEY